MRASPAAPPSWRGRSILLVPALAAVVALPAGAQRAAGRPAGAPPGTPARVTPAEFRALHWIQGSWRGRMPDGRYFYERYTVADDSTIVVQMLADSTFVRVTGTDSIVHRAGAVRYDGSVAMRLDDTGVSFGRADAPGQGFAFTRAGRGWTAVIRSTGGDGRPRFVTYQMEPASR